MKPFLRKQAHLLSACCSPTATRPHRYLNAHLSILTTLTLFLGAAVVAAHQPTTRQRATDSVSDREDAAKRKAQIVQPKGGWIYVLDSNNNKSESQIIVLDPENDRVIKTFKTGHVPDMALSPDGTRLYVTSTLNSSTGYGRDVLQVIDTTTDEVLQMVDNPHRWRSTVSLYPSHMALSPDGRWLYSFRYETKDETRGAVFYYVATFDTVRGLFLRDNAAVPYCGTAAALVPLPEGRRLDVVCYQSNEVQFLNLTKTGAAFSLKKGAREPGPMLLSPRGAEAHARRVGPAFLSPDGRILTVIMGDGRFFKIDTESRAVAPPDAVDRDARRTTDTILKTTDKSDDWLADSWIRYQAPVLSPDRTTIYLGIGRLIHLHQGVQALDRIVVLDSQSLKRIGMIKTSQPFFSITISKDGRRLYAISPEQASLTVIDTATQREIRTIYGIGTTPIRAIVAP